MLVVPSFDLYGDVTNAAQVLQQLASSATNHLPAGPSGSPTAGRELAESYLRWTETAAEALSHHLGAEKAEEIIQTQNYWAIRTANDNSPRLIALVWNEAPSRGRLLTAIAETITNERKRWADEGATIVVPDTNVFLQENKPFDQVGWPSAVGSQIDVRLVFPMVVIHELDRLKRQGNNTTRTAARHALRWMVEHLPLQPDRRSAPLSKSIPTTTIEVDVDGSPSKVEDADGEIIRFARRLAIISKLPTLLVTYDLGMRLRAATFGVKAIQLPDEEN